VDERLIPATRAYFKGLSQTETPLMSSAMSQLVASNGALPPSALQVIHQDPVYSALLKTTCVATLFSGGTRVNALPVSATANVNCRILPDETVEQVRDRLRKIITDPGVEITLADPFGQGPASSAEGPVPQAVREAASEIWAGTPVIPSVQTGATDSRFIRAKGIQAYGLTPFYLTNVDRTRAHGIDERIPVASIRPGVEYYYRVVMKLAGA
jgi:acetylornithine deacetylase/succinyl-diaminopimelate desuccinylase-like protein